MRNNPLSNTYITLIISWLVLNVCFNCIDQDYVYRNMDISILWHCRLVSCTPSEPIGLFMGVRSSSVKCHLVYLLLIPWYSCISSWNMRLLLRCLWQFCFILNYMLIILIPSSSGSANAHLTGCFRFWPFLLNKGLDMIPLDFFMSCLDFLQGYSTGDFQALELIALVVFDALD